MIVEARHITGRDGEVVVHGRVRAVAGKCPVHRTLTSEIAIRTELV
jgi:hypothetical protein